MSSSQTADTFVIFYAERSNCWAAISLQTRQVGIGDNPKDALANALAYAKQAAEAPPESQRAHVCTTSQELMHILGKTAQPLPDGEYAPGVVYKYEQA